MGPAAARTTPPRPARPAASSSSTRCWPRAPTSPSACPVRAIWPRSTPCTTPQDRFTLIVCRQEGGAAYMAEAYGKLTGRPGICFVTRGPGATNAAIGVHTAFQDSTPMILFVGQVARDQLRARGVPGGRLPPHVRQRSPSGSPQIDDPARIPEYVGQAFHRAVNGRPGPVVLALPEDMLTDRADAAPPARFKPVRRCAERRRSLARSARPMLDEAERPLLVLGGGGWDAEAVGRHRSAFAEALHCRSACAFRCQDLFDNTHPNYAGDVGIGINPRLAARVQRCRPPARRRRAAGRDDDRRLHAARHPACPRRSSCTSIRAPRSSAASIRPSCRSTPAMARFRRHRRQAMRPVACARWATWTAAGARRLPRMIDAAARSKLAIDMRRGRGDLAASSACRADAILTNGAGNYASWSIASIATASSAPSSRRPTARWAMACPRRSRPSCAHPDRTVVCFTGDGCFLMNGQELATAVQYSCGRDLRAS